MSDKRVDIVIPARLASTRLPEKILADVNGKPLIQYTYQRALQATAISDIYIAVDDERVYDIVTQFGAKAILTPKELPSGTDRVAYVLREMSSDYVINLQADEPLIDPGHLDLIAEILKKGEDPVVTLAERKEDFQHFNDPNHVKVVFDYQGRALYFTRSAIPFFRQKRASECWYKHIGVYGYSSAFLLQFVEMSKTPLECSENLEQLRILEYRYAIKVLVVEADTIGIDTQEDLERLRERLWKNTSL